MFETDRECDQGFEKSKNTEKQNFQKLYNKTALAYNSTVKVV